MPLTDTAIRNAKPRDKAHKITDGGGLYLLVTPAGGRLWRLKYRLDGVERKLAIGKYPDVTLGEARKARDTARSSRAPDTIPAPRSVGSGHLRRSRQQRPSATLRSNT
jgi:hypothetical protein